MGTSSHLVTIITAVMVSIMPDTVDTVIWARDDGWRYHPKHVEWFTDINKLYVVTSCWIIIDTYYEMHRPVNIKYSRSFFGSLSWEFLVVVCSAALSSSIYASLVSSDNWTVERWDNKIMHNLHIEFLVEQLQKVMEGSAISSEHVIIPK